MKRRYVLPVLAMTVWAPLAGAQAGYAPPQPGTLITWSYQFEDKDFIRLSEIIATGPDFVIYDPDLRYSSGNPGEYLVEFSGIHTQSCDQILPDEDDRAALAALWPLTSGTSATVKQGKSSVYAVGEKVDIDLIASIENAGEAWKVRGDYGDIGLQITVSAAAGMPVRMDWDSGGTGRVLEIVEPAGSVSDSVSTEAELGECAKLLQ